MYSRIKIAIKYTPLILLAGTLFIGGNAAGAADIVVTGSWSEAIDTADLQAGAGSDLVDTYESASNAVSLDISKSGGGPQNYNWRVDVKKSDTNWHGNFVLSVIRTSDGNDTGGGGQGTVSGGASYQVVTDTDQSFFSGTRNRDSMNIQLKLGGVSVQIPPDTYTTTVYYTVVEI